MPRYRVVATFENEQKWDVPIWIGEAEINGVIISCMADSNIKAFTVVKERQ